MSELYALVTGATRGIGRTLALKLAEAGYHVAFCYRNQSDAEALTAELSSTGRQVLAIYADLSSPESIEQLFSSYSEHFPQLDLLVNNAGITADSLLAVMDEQQLTSVITLNLLAPIRCCKAALQLMLPRRSGNIINISSVSAQKPNPGQTSYAASKGGLEAFSRALAVEVAKKRIRVNCVAPGVIETDMVQELLASQGEQLKKRILSNRFGQPEDVARAVLYLAEPGNHYVTGEVLAVNGGLLLS